MTLLPRMLLTFLLLLSSVRLGRASTVDTDLALIKKRLAERYLATASDAVPQTVEELLAQLQPNGSWPDLIYSDPANPEGVGFTSYPHTSRLRKLAGAHASATDPATRTRLADAIHRALGWWLQRRPVTQHKWYMQIGAPTQLAQTAILFEADLTAEELAGLTPLLRTALQPDGGLDYSGQPATGQNLMWEAGVMIVSGCLVGDADFARRYVRRAEQEMVVTMEEGIQHDWSFHQHGPQLYSGGLYGLTFADDTARWAAVLRGTSLALAEETVNVLTSQVLDGQQWMVRGRQLDFVTRSRHIAWPRNLTAGGVFPTLDPICDELATLGGPRTGELRAFARRLRGETPAETGPRGARVYWRSDYVVFQRPKFFASARMSSLRVAGHESGTGQNDHGYHLGDGVFTLMVDGNEYDGIYPLWDWRRLPGVTAVYNPAVPLPKHSWGHGAQGGAEFAGGVDDGELAAAAMELHHGGAHARKAWFFLGDAIVCLGSDLRSYDQSLSLVTGVNQCWGRGGVRSSAQRDELVPGRLYNETAPGWIWHHGVAYLFPEGGDRRVQVESKRASWNAINTFPGAPDDIASGDVFSLWLEHGPGEGRATYAYIVVPGLAPDDIPNYQKNSAPAILANSPRIQAVSTPGVIQAVFWTAGTLPLPAGGRLTVDQACIVQLRLPHENRPATLSAGNPTQRVRKLNVTWDDGGDHNSALTVPFDFPDGPFAGQPQTKTLD